MENKNELIIDAEAEVIESSKVVDIEPVQSVEVVDILSQDEAEKLTKDIQSTTTALYVLLKKAHDTKAWLSLGHKSWTEYIEKEFDFSRARSYQLINQATVIEEINNASGAPIYISEKEARDIKKRLPEITKKLKEDVKDAGLSGDKAEEKVKEILEDEEKRNIDNAVDESFKSNSHAEDEYQEPEEDNALYTSNKQMNANLSHEDEQFYENLIISLKFMKELPNPTLFGEKVKNCSKNKKELNQLSEQAFAWLTKFMDELE